MPDPQTSDTSDKVNDVSASSGISSPGQAENSMSQRCKIAIYVKYLLFPYLSFLVFIHDYIRCVDFTLIAASNTASDDVTN